MRSTIKKGGSFRCRWEKEKWRFLAKTEFSESLRARARELIKGAKYSKKTARSQGQRLLTNANIQKKLRDLKFVQNQAGYSKKTANQKGPKLLVNVGIQKRLCEFIKGQNTTRKPHILKAKGC